MEKKSYPCSDRVCSKCYYLPFCAAEGFCGFDSENKDCPNYDEGMHQIEIFEKEFKGE